MNLEAVGSDMPMRAKVVKYWFFLDLLRARVNPARLFGHTNKAVHTKFNFALASESGAS